MPDSVGQSWDVIWCQSFCGHWGQHPDLTSPWEGVSTIRAVCWDSAHRCSLLSELSCCLLPSSTFQFPSLCHGNCHVLSEAFPNPSSDTSMPCQPCLVFTTGCFNFAHTGLSSMLDSNGPYWKDGVLSLSTAQRCFINTYRLMWGHVT